jgi:thymidine kinase
MARIEIIIGCMFSGKSTELIRRISRYEAIGYKVLVINHELDTRTDYAIQTHSDIRYSAIKSSRLMTPIFINSNEFNDAKVIGIDEAQFFPDLREFALFCEAHDKILIMSGLSGDFMRRPFGHILECIPLCDDVCLLSAMDMRDNDGSSAIFSKRISSTTELTDIGASDKYIAVSRKNYLQSF